MMNLFRNRHVQLHDGDTDDSANDSNALLPRSKKTAFRAFLSQMGMICALVGAGSLQPRFRLFSEA
jgi:hypothetical protein